MNTEGYVATWLKPSRAPTPVYEARFVLLHGARRPGVRTFPDKETARRYTEKLMRRVGCSVVWHDP